MASITLTDPRIVMNEFEIAADMSSVALDYAAELQDNTTFGSTSRKRVSGLKAASLQGEGYVDPETIDEELYDAMAVPNTVFLLSPDSGDTGEPGYIMQAVVGSYSPGAAHGEVYGFSISGDSETPLVRGLMLNNANVASTSNSTGVEVGAAASGQTIYASIHCTDLNSTAGQITAVLQSDSTGAFSSPATVHTFTSISALTSEWAAVAGPNTDTYYRLAFTVDSGSPNFKIIAAVGIV